MDTLHELLRRSLALPPEYREGLSSHLPMALHALASLGAADERLRAFHARYAERFGQARAPRPAEPLADWRGARGHIEAFAALGATFAGLLAQHGRDTTLRLVLPDLWPGAAGAAFHGLIRTAHAMQHGEQGELAAALAYWAARWQPVPPPAPSPAPVLEFDEWARRLQAAAMTLHPPGSLISDRIAAAVRSAPYAELADRLVAMPTLQPLADWAASTYAWSGNFTVLHLVTATRAARVLSPWATDDAQVRQGFVRAFAAGALASRLQAGREAARPAPRTWDEVRAAAIASDDDHVVKLVHALLEERAVYGEGERLAAAARAVA